MSSDYHYGSLLSDRTEQSVRHTSANKIILYEVAMDIIAMFCDILTRNTDMEDVAWCVYQRASMLCL